MVVDYVREVVSLPTEINVLVLYFFYSTIYAWSFRQEVI